MNHREHELGELVSGEGCLGIPCISCHRPTDG